MSSAVSRDFLQLEFVLINHSCPSRFVYRPCGQYEIQTEGVEITYNC